MYDISQNPVTCILYTEHQSQVSAPGPMTLLFILAYADDLVMFVALKCVWSFSCCHEKWILILQDIFNVVYISVCRWSLMFLPLKCVPLGWLSGECVRLMTWWLWVQSWLRRLFFSAYFTLSPLQKHVRKVVGGFGKKSCVSTGVRKSGNTYASLTTVIWL